MDLQNKASGIRYGDSSDYGGLSNHETLKEIHPLLRDIEDSDSYTWTHSVNVANYSYTLADMLGHNSQSKINIYIGALLHDIGKTKITEKILKKPGALSPDEWITLKTHPIIGYEMLLNIDWLMDPEIPQIALEHHERYDGGGYPFGLSGEDISLAGRIVAVADCFDAMTSNRVYRNAKDKQVAAQEILRNAGKQFDPHIAKVFVDFLLSGEPLLPVPTQLHNMNLFNKQKSS